MVQARLTTLPPCTALTADSQHAPLLPAKAAKETWGHRPVCVLPRVILHVPVVTGLPGDEDVGLGGPLFNCHLRHQGQRGLLCCPHGTNQGPESGTAVSVPLPVLLAAELLPLLVVCSSLTARSLALHALSQWLLATSTCLCCAAVATTATATAVAAVAATAATAAATAAPTATGFA